MNFSNWLRAELNKRQWTYAELARRSGVQTTQISRVINGSQRGGPDLCIAIAKGLELSREQVFRARGWLLPQPDDPYGPQLDPRAEQLAQKVSRMSLQSREITLNAMEAMLNSAHQLAQIRESPAEYDTKHPDA